MPLPRYYQIITSPQFTALYYITLAFDTLLLKNFTFVEVTVHKAKLSLSHHEGIRSSTAPLILNLETRWR
jgi:hypothetical protein